MVVGKELRDERGERDDGVGRHADGHCAGCVLLVGVPLKEAALRLGVAV